MNCFRLIFLTILFLIFNLSHSLAQNPWVKTGGPIGGLGYNIRIHPDNPNIMFVTDVFTGVNKSIDGGETWVSSNNGINTRTGPTGGRIPVFALTIDPFDTNEVWVGTQNDDGIYFSSDTGENYELRNNGITEEGLTIRNFKVTKLGSKKIVYMSCEQDIGVQGDEFSKVKGVLFKTEDQGLNWTKVWEGESLARWLEVIPEETSDADVKQKLILSTGIFDREAFNTSGEGVVISNDGGDNWSTSNENITSLFVGGMHAQPSNPETIIIGTGNNVNTINQVWGAVYKSTDAGNNWTIQLGKNNGDEVEDKFTAVQFSKSNNNVVYAANEFAVYRSDDSGESWVRKTPEGVSWGPSGVIAGFPIEITIDAANEDIVFINNYGGGVFKSEDAGITWVTLSNGYTGAEMHAVAVSQQNHSKVVSIARNGPFLSTTRGEKWSGIAFGEADFPEWYDITFNPENDSEIMLTDEHQGWILKSSDDGQSWERLYRHPDIPEPQNQLPEDRHGVRQIVYAPSNQEIIYGGYANAGIDFGPAFEESNSTVPSSGNGYDGFVGDFESSYGMVRSKNGGAAGSWESINNGLGGKLNVTSIEVNPSNSDELYITLRSGGVYKSTDAGDNWTDITNSLPERNIYSLVVSQEDFQTLYVGTRFYGVYKSTDGGTNWNRVLAPFRTVAVDEVNSLFGALAINPVDPNVIVAADWWTGIFISSDAGSTWNIYNNSLSMKVIRDLEFSRDGKFLYAGSSGEGVFKMQFSNEALASLSSSTLEFGEIEISQSQTTSVILENYGNFSMNVIEYIFDNQAVSTTNQASSLSAGAKFEIPIKFAPISEGETTGSLTIKTDIGDFNIQYSGSAIYSSCSTTIDISGNNIICSGESSSLSGPNGYDNYVWYKNGTIISNENSEVLTIDEAGTYKVRVIDSGVCASFSSDFAVEEAENPGQTIEIEGFTLISPEGASYQWFLNGEPIEGETGNTTNAYEAGVYTVEITNEAGCIVISDPVTTTSIENSDLHKRIAKINPNPSQGHFTFELMNKLVFPLYLELVDISGHVLWNKKDVISNQVEVNLSLNTSNGVYIMRVVDGSSEVFSFKVLIDK